MTKETSVVENRNLYIGGSDIPIILGISKFKTRFQLLLEKAGLAKDTFEGNEYTDYGNVMEIKIRDYINSKTSSPYYPDCRINGDIRCNVDGYNFHDTILEIKTTSKICDDVDDYQVYLVQLLFYMANYRVQFGHLAVYDRPSDFNTDFDSERLYEYYINIDDYQTWLQTIFNAVEQFKIDLERVKANPFITEEELQPNELIEISYQIMDLEVQLANYKKIQQQYDDLKVKLYDIMSQDNIKKWTTNNGVQITRVDPILATTVEETVFDENTFKQEHEQLYNNYLIDIKKVKKGRSGYVKITL